MLFSVPFGPKFDFGDGAKTDRLRLEYPPKNKLTKFHSIVHNINY